MLEGAPGESFDAFCADLMAEFRASLMGGATPTPTNPATTMLPIDVVPAGCTSAQTKHTELEAKLAEINELAALRDFVAPRVANADKMAALCGGKKELLEGPTVGGEAPTRAATAIDRDHDGLWGACRRPSWRGTPCW